MAHEAREPCRSYATRTGWAATPVSAARVAIANLPAFPYITVKTVEQLTARANVTALNALAHLTEKGILTRHPNRRKGDTWEAKELFVLLDEFERAAEIVH